MEKREVTCCVHCPFFDWEWRRCQGILESRKIVEKGKDG